MTRGDRHCERMKPDHPWLTNKCNCDAPATHVCSENDIAFAVACEWHAFRWVREAP